MQTLWESDAIWVVTMYQRPGVLFARQTYRALFEELRFMPICLIQNREWAALQLPESDRGPHYENS